MRYLTGLAACAFVLAVAPGASASHVFACEPEAQVVCTVSDTSEHILCGRWITC